MRERGFEEFLIAAASGSVEVDDESIKEARRVFRELFEKYKKEIAPEADKVRAAGGLFIIGTERHESRRIDNQLRGRSGRQGDPGESRFYLSLEDDLMRLFGSDRIAKVIDRLGIPDDTPIDAKILSNTIESAQKRIEDQNFKRRKYVLTYDDVMNQQRNLVYKERQAVLNGENISETIQKMILGTLNEHIDRHLGGDDPAAWDLIGLREAYKGILTNANDFEYSAEELKKLNKQDIEEEFTNRALEKYKEKEEQIGADRFREIERAILPAQCRLSLDGSYRHYGRPKTPSVFSPTLSAIP